MQPINREVARQAAYWLMLMHSGECDGRRQQDCARWRAADPEHERAWQRAAQVQEKLGILPVDMAMGTLNRERRQALKRMLVLALLLPAGYLSQQLVSRQQLLADVRTGAGERRDMQLADGSRLFLNSGSAVDVLFSASERLIRLRRGEILIDSGKDAGQATYRPLRVATGQGVLQALGTRFAVRSFEEQALTRLSVFDGAVRIQPLHGPAVTLTAGQQASFSSGQTGPQSAASESDASWTRGQLIADDMPLGEFIAELARHRNGWLRCAPEVASLRISGTFQLASADAILAALPATLPVAVDVRTRYWVTVRSR